MNIGPHADARSKIAHSRDLAGIFTRLGSVPAPGLFQSNEAIRVLNQLSRIVTHAIFEDDLHVLEIRDLCGRIAFHNYDVRLPARSQTSHPVEFSQILRPVVGSDM